MIQGDAADLSPARDRVRRGRHRRMVPVRPRPFHIAGPAGSSLIAVDIASGDATLLRAEPGAQLSNPATGPARRSPARAADTLWTTALTTSAAYVTRIRARRPAPDR
jgi:hypothetical protein